MESESASYMTCKLIVDTQSPGWLISLVKFLALLKGVVTSFSLDALNGSALVCGKMDADGVLMVLKKVGDGHIQLYQLDYGLHPPPQIILKSNQTRDLQPKHNNHPPSYAAPPPNLNYSAHHPECNFM